MRPVLGKPLRRVKPPVRHPLRKLTGAAAQISADSANAKASVMNALPADGHAAALAVLHAEKPLRIWSLIVTIFGDLVMDQGRVAEPPAMWVAPLLNLLELLGIDGALARTNFSRLVANGTLARTKSGRNTFYRPSETSRREFLAAADRIYGRRQPALSPRLTLAVIDRCKDRSKARTALEKAGFTMIAPTVALGPESATAGPIPAGAILSMAHPSPALSAAADDAWNLSGLNAAYRKFINNFSNLSQAELVPVAAVATRIIAVHQFRRLILREPPLAAGLLPSPWHGEEARALFEAICRRTNSAVQQWINDTSFYGQPSP